MPISKHGNLYYTDKQHDFARYETSALEYALAQGYPLIKKGKYYHHKEHSSMVFVEKTGMWFWNSRQIQGGALKFITHYEHRSYVEAVLILNGENIQTLQNQPIQKDDVRKQARETVEEKKEFKLPSQNQNYARMFAYLLKERKLDPDLVSALVKDKKIFESAEHHNAVFVGYDEHGVPRNAYQRGTNSFMDKPFKRDVAGSDKQYPFHIEGIFGCRTVSVFESPIDAISHASLAKLNGEKITDTHRISLAGVADKALMWFLQQHPEIDRIILCLDNDQAGKNAIKAIADKLQGSNYNILYQFSNTKDFNSDLVVAHKQLEAQARMADGHYQATPEPEPEP